MNRTSVLKFIILCSFLAFSNTPATAQITPDNTLGAESSRIVPNGNIDKIDGGALRDRNLFHSFKEFNINNGQSVYFNNPSGIENILTRVTGGNASNILGTLGVDGAANLFLINPKGIVFGENARLDVNGSFVGTTASGLQFGEQGNFSATNPQAPPLLTVNITPGLQYGNNHPSRTIKNTGNLTVGKDLTLYAGSLDLQGRLEAEGNLTLQATDTVKVRDSLENPFIAAAGGKLLVQGNESVNIFALNHPDSGLFSGGDMVLRSANPVLGDAHYWSGGNFQIQQTNGDLGELYSDSDPIIRSAGDVSFYGYIGASLHILAGGSVDINTAIITGADTTGNTINPQNTPELANVTLSDGTFLVIDGSAKPTLDIRAGMKPEAIGIPLGTSGNPGNLVNSSLFIENPPINNPVATNANITVGDVRFDAIDGNVLLTNQYQPNTSLPGGDIRITQDGLLGTGIFTRSAGSLSNVTIDSRGDFIIDGRFIDTSSNRGNAGDINIIADFLSMTNGAALFTNSLGIGDGGNVTIKARDSVSLDGVGNNGLSTFISSGLNSEAQGRAGNITIDTDSLFVTNGAVLNASNLGSGSAGKVKITAIDSVSFDGFGVVSNGIILQSGALSTVSQGEEGIKNGGIEIVTGSLSLTNGGIFNTGTLGNGDGGDVTIAARDSVLLNNGKIFSNPLDLNFTGSVNGNGGDIKITTSSLVLTNGSSLTASTLGNGRGGDIQVKATDFVSVKGGSDISSNTFGKGNAGNIEITAGNTVTFDGVRFSDGVDLSLIGLEGIPEAREISTSASTAVLRGLGGKVGQGKGGDLRIKTGSLFVTNGAFLSTLTLGEGDRADAGNIIIRAKDLVFLDGNSRISGVVAAVIPAEDGKNLRFEVTGDGGDIDIQARSLFLKDSAGLNTSTLSSGKAGDILLDIAESVTISGVAVIEDDDNNKNFSPAGLFSETNTLKATGEGGKIDINTGILRISDGAVLSASSESVAKAGDVIVNVNELELTGGGEIFTTAFNTGVAGNITINATDKITISGTQFTRFEMPSGGLFANSNSPQATKAGNINVKALVVLMDNQGKISTETSSGDGGNINLQLGELLLLRNNSQISTTAGTAQAGGDGGNISINSPFIVALPNEDSDITANAFAGRGGNVDIITQGIFGIQPRSQTTLQSDITASSQRSIQGEISVTEPEIDPSQGLLELPSGVIDKSDQIAQICPRGINAKKLSEFYITGRGSLPPSPLDMLTGTVELSRLASLDGESVRGGRGATALGGFPDLKQLAWGRGGRGGRIYKESQEIVEAQGFMKAENGEIHLVAQAPSATPSATISKSACVEAAQK